MSRIKNIYCFGTSFTNGGGFEFEENMIEPLHLAYSNIDELQTQFNFSYPGQLLKLLNNSNLDIKVHNFSKSGYGNHRINRIIWDLVNEPDFDISTSLFILEFAHFGRHELYYTLLNDYIICNSHIENDVLKFHDASHTYHSKKHRPQNDSVFLNKNKFENFINESIEFLNEIKESVYATHSLLGFLINNNYNIILTQPPMWNGPPDDYHKDYFRYQLFEEPGYGIMEYLRDNPTHVIKNETGGNYNDSHGGIVFSKTIASLIYNRLIDMNLISTEYHSIDINDVNNLKRIILKNTKLFNKI